MSIKEKEKDEKNKLLEKAKETKIYKNVLNNFSDATLVAVSYTHLRAHETTLHLVCRLLLEKKNDRF